MTLFKKATNPRQYDVPDLKWHEEAGIESPFRSFFWRQLGVAPQEWNGASVLDIGAGSGWLLAEAKKHGAERVLGIEPSRSNVAMAEARFPDIPLVEATLEDFETDQHFSKAVSVMAFPHIGNLDVAFERIGRLVEPGGRVILIVPDFEYFKRPRHDFAIEYQEHGPEEYVVSVTRPNGTLTDIVRKNHLYAEAARKYGLQLESEFGLKPDEELMNREPKYRAFENQPICQRLIFRKD